VKILLVSLTFILNGAFDSLKGQTLVNPVVEFKFNGDLSDSKNNVSNALNYGASFTTNRFGIVNSALKYTGTGGYAKIAGLNNVLNGATELTISGWYLFSTPAPNSPYHWATGFKTASPSIGLGVFVDGSPNYGIGVHEGTTGDVYTNARMTNLLNSWNQIVLVLKVNSLPALYLNGVAQTWAAPGSPQAPTALSAPIQFNSDYGLGVQFMDGGVDFGASRNNSYGAISDLKFYTAALNNNQVQNLYTNESIPEPSAFSLLAVGLGVVLRRRRRTV